MTGKFVVRMFRIRLIFSVIVLEYEEGSWAWVCAELVNTIVNYSDLRYLPVSSDGYKGLVNISDFSKEFLDNG